MLRYIYFTFSLLTLSRRGVKSSVFEEDFEYNSFLGVIKIFIYLISFYRVLGIILEFKNKR